MSSLFLCRLYCLCNWRSKELVMQKWVTWLITCLVQTTFLLSMPHNLWKRGAQTTWSFFSHTQTRTQNGPWWYNLQRTSQHPVPRKQRTLAFLRKKSLLLSGFLVLYSKGISPKHIFIFKLGLFSKFDFTSRHHNSNSHVRMNTCSKSRPKKKSHASLAKLCDTLEDMVSL